MKNQVKIMRVVRDMKQKDLAAQIGISRQTLSLIEKNKYNPTIKLCLKLAEALDTDLNTLFWRGRNE